ncbi:MAG: TatD family deoxyribonuclease [Ruminococcaceae bacterium]|nr:TatD family deoxyribonuclease [Oscillospiraceae bacterium]
MDFIFDTHAHYNDKAFNEDRTTLLDSFLESGILGVVNCGTDIESSKKSIELSEQYDFMYCAVGFHPEDISKANENYLTEIRKLSKHKKCVAIGEIGLDYYWTKDNKEEQKRIFTEQVILANELNLPVIVHSRDAHNDTLEILKKYKPKGVLHCFSGSVEVMKEVLKLNMYIGLGGAVTFKNARVPLEVAENLPLERLLLETDCPYMTPVPYRGKRNQSTYISFVAEKIAEVKNLKKEEILTTANKNASKLFNINL